MNKAVKFLVKQFVLLRLTLQTSSPRNHQLLSSNRYGESRAAYREVQERHEDIKRIEKTLGELAQLFNDVCLFL